MTVNEGYFNNVERSNDEIVNDINSENISLSYKFAFVIEKSNSLRDFRQIIHPSISSDVRDRTLSDMFSKDVRRLKIVIDNLNMIDSYKIMIETYDTCHRDYLKKENPLEYSVDDFLHNDIFIKKLESMKEYDVFNIGIKVMFNAEEDESMKQFMDDVKKIRSFAAISGLFETAYTHWLRYSEDRQVEEIQVIYIGHYDKLNILQYYNVYDNIFDADYLKDDKGFSDENLSKYKTIYAKNSKFTKLLLHIDLKKPQFENFIIKDIIGFTTVSNEVPLILDVEPVDKSKDISYIDVCQMIYDNFIVNMTDEKIFGNRDVIISLTDGTWISDIDDIDYNPKLIAHDDEMKSKFYLGFGDNCKRYIKTGNSKSHRDKFIGYYEHAQMNWMDIKEGTLFI